MIDHVSRTAIVSNRFPSSRRSRPGGPEEEAMGAAAVKKATRKARLAIDVEWADITKAEGDAFVVGHYIGVLPQNAELALDIALSGTSKPSRLVLTDLTRRGAIRGALGDVMFSRARTANKSFLRAWAAPGCSGQGLQPSDPSGSSGQDGVGGPADHRTRSNARPHPLGDAARQRSAASAAAVHRPNEREAANQLRRDPRKGARRCDCRPWHALRMTSFIDW